MDQDGWKVVPLLLLVAVVCLVLRDRTPSGVLAGAGIVIGLLGIGVGLFLRDPERTIPQGDNMILSAADGRVMAIQEIDEPVYVNGRAMQISVFLSIFNVHINRMPATGVVRFRQHVQGEYLLAYKGTASEKNEQMVVGLEGAYGRIIVKQIVGFIARRIVCRVNEGQRVQAGERFGLIRFGSRVDVIVPLQTKIMVHVGDRVKGGETILGVFQ